MAKTDTVGGRTPGVHVGGIEYGAMAGIPAPLIAITYPDAAQAKEAARLINAAQSGTRPFETGAAMCVGDTQVKVRARSQGDGIFMEAFLYLKPSHLTAAVYGAGVVDKEVYKAFSHLLAHHRSYTFSVMVGQEVFLRDLHLQKYNLDEKEVRI